MNIIDRITELRVQRGWSINYLALEAGLTQSTLNSILQRGTAPKIETLQCLCNAFGISLAQFFIEDEQLEILSSAEKQLITCYRSLTAKKQQALLEFLSQ